MKNLLLLLVLANVLYFMWSMFAAEGPQPGGVGQQSKMLGRALQIHDVLGPGTHISLYLDSEIRCSLSAGASKFNSEGGAGARRIDLDA